MGRVGRSKVTFNPFWSLIKVDSLQLQLVVVVNVKLFKTPSMSLASQLMVVYNPREIEAMHDDVRMKINKKAREKNENKIQ